jgi:DNA-binding transcriptional regulator YiaG
VQPTATTAPRKRRPLSPDELRQLHESTGVSQHVDTAKGAALLGLEPQTLRRWACHGSGPIRPVKVNGRLRWRVADIQAVLAGSAA